MFWEESAILPKPRRGSTTNKELEIKTRPIHENEFPELIEFDDLYLQKAMNKIGVPLEQLAPPLTLEELEQALKRNDILEWILIDHNLGGYFWFERQAASLYISAIAIRKEYQGKGIIQSILDLADKHAKKNHLSKCSLSISPLNSRALNVYLKNGYRIIGSISAFFGSKHSSSFRLMMEKDLENSGKIEYSNDIREILCCDYSELKNATDNGYVGIELIQTSIGNNRQNKIRFIKLR